MRERGWSSWVIAAMLLSACDGGGGDAGGQHGDLCTTVGNVCSTTACAQFPTTAGCGQPVSPVNGYCPVDQYHCWDATTSKDYCDSKKGACGKPKASGVPCPAKICSKADLDQCYDTTTDVFCGPMGTCVTFSTACSASDGGASMGDASPAPVDAGTPHG